MKIKLAIIGLFCQLFQCFLPFWYQVCHSASESMIAGYAKKISLLFVDFFILFITSGIISIDIVTVPYGGFWINRNFAKICDDQCLCYRTNFCLPKLLTHQRTWQHFSLNESICPIWFVVLSGFEWFCDAVFIAIFWFDWLIAVITHPNTSPNATGLLHRGYKIPPIMIQCVEFWGKLAQTDNQTF